MLTPFSPLLQIVTLVTYYIVYYGITAIIIAIFVRVIATWVNIDERFAFIRFLARITDPFLVPCRRIIGRVGFFDLSFLVATFLLITLRTLLVQSLPL